MKKTRRSGETLTMFLKVQQQNTYFELPGNWNSPHDQNLAIEDFSNFPIPPVQPPGATGQLQQVSSLSVDYGPNNIDSPYSVPTGSFQPHTPSTTEDQLDAVSEEQFDEPSIYSDMLQDPLFGADPYLDFNFKDLPIDSTRWEGTWSFIDSSQLGNTNGSITSADELGREEMPSNFQVPWFNPSTQTP